MQQPVLWTFGGYLILLLIIGLLCYRRNENLEDYLIGGRRLGPWVTAFSAQASDMSGWLLMGLPGALYLSGLVDAWIAIGLFLGTCANWVLVARRLRTATEQTGALTLPRFFEVRFGDPTGLLRWLSGLTTLVFFTIYASSGLVATGSLFESIFGVPYTQAVLTGGLVVIAYTLLGGFLAVCWTDLFQGALMILALVVVPLLGLATAGGLSGIAEALEAKRRSVTLAASPVSVISAMAWGLGYFGQPHILARFMGSRSPRTLERSAAIAIVWVLISLGGAVLAGLVAVSLFDGYRDGREERVFIEMIACLVPSWAAGVMLAAILSAILSTIDSQLLVASSVITEDLLPAQWRRSASVRARLWFGRFGVLVISGLALLLALEPRATILEIVANAWGGFGAALGPVVLYALYARHPAWRPALAGMVTGTVVLVAWKSGPWADSMYELLPGFAANGLVILLGVGLGRLTGETRLGSARGD